MAVDQFSSLVSILLRGDGDDGLLDISPQRLPIDTGSRAIKSTTVKKYGAASIYLDGGGVVGSTVDYVRYGYRTNAGYTPALGLDNKDFTIRFWINPQATSEPYPLVLCTTDSINNNVWQLSVDHTSAPNKYAFWVGNYSFSTPLLTSASNVVYGAWAHIEITRIGSAFRLAVNGVVEATATFAGNTAGTSDYLYVGHRCPCHIDDLQIYKGVALHSGDFTPPTAELEIDPISVSEVGALKAPVSLPIDALKTTLVGNTALARDEYSGGNGRVRGTVKLKDSPINTPLARRVYLFTEDNMRLIRTAYSDATTGAYDFQWIDKSRKYTVMSLDYQHALRAVVADNLTAEAMS